MTLGWRHILSGWDHLAFLAALLLATRSARGLLGVITAFTVALSVTLALSTLGYVHLGPRADLVEAAIALSVAYVAAETLLFPRTVRSRWPEAFLFGLVHGLGFAGFVQESLVREEARALALVAFNVGVELGQVAVVLALLLLLRAVPDARRAEREFLAPEGLRRGGSAVIVVLGLAWFFARL